MAVLLLDILRIAGNSWLPIGTLCFIFILILALVVFKVIGQRKKTDSLMETRELVMQKVNDEIVKQKVTRRETNLVGRISIKNTRILLVDDEPDILEFLSYNFKKEGYQVFTAPDGIDAIQIAKKVSPTLIILDVMMPVMDGIETCKKLRLLPEAKDALIVFLTARIDEYSKTAGHDAGADEYILKPIKPRIFINHIRALLGHTTHK